MSIKPWRKVRSRQSGDYRVFTVRTDLKVNPRTGGESELYVIESVDWVNVIAVTPDDQLVMVEQYRHGSDTVELEIPGGMIDPEDGTPTVAGIRELREETGYAGDDALVIGRAFPNPAIMSNTCHFVLIRNCRAAHETAFDHGEDIVTRLVPISSVPGLVAAGKIRHALVLVALYRYEMWRRGAAAE